MQSKRRKFGVNTLRKSRKKAFLKLSKASKRRDPKTNVYIPTDAEVAEAKAWAEFCKL